MTKEELDAAIRKARREHRTAELNELLEKRKQLIESGSIEPERNEGAERLREAQRGTAANTFDTRGDGNRTLSELAGVSAEQTERNVAAAREQAERERRATEDYDRVTNGMESDGEVHSREELEAAQRRAADAVGVAESPSPDAPTGDEAKKQISKGTPEVDFNTNPTPSPSGSANSSEPKGNDSGSGNGGNGKAGSTGGKKDEQKADDFLQTWKDTHPTLFHAIFGKSTEKGGDNPLTLGQRLSLLGAALANMAGNAFGGYQAGFNRQQFTPTELEYSKATEKYMNQGIEEHLGTFQSPEKMKSVTNGYLEQAKMYTEKALELREKAKNLTVENYSDIMNAVTLKVGIAKGLQSENSNASSNSGKSHTSGLNGGGNAGANIGGIVNLGGSVTGSKSDSTNASYTSADGKTVDLLGISALQSALDDARNLGNVTDEAVRGMKEKLTKAADEYDKLADELREKAAEYASHEFGNSASGKSPATGNEKSGNEKSGNEKFGNEKSKDDSLRSDERSKDFSKVAGERKSGFLKGKNGAPFNIDMKKFLVQGEKVEDKATDERKTARDRTAMQSQVNQLVSQSMASNPSAPPIAQMPVKA